MREQFAGFAARFKRDQVKNGGGDSASNTTPSPPREDYKLKGDPIICPAIDAIFLCYFVCLDLGKGSNKLVDASQQHCLLFLEPPQLSFDLNAIVGAAAVAPRHCSLKTNILLASF
jgi:hypothetical protein